MANAQNNQTANIVFILAKYGPEAWSEMLEI